jgi:hypothetical protein
LDCSVRMEVNEDVSSEEVDDVSADTAGVREG